VILSFIVLSLVFVPMLIEAGRAAANEREQRTRGGIEASGDVYATMRWAYPLSFAGMIAEGAWRDGAPGVALAAGAVVFGAAKVLKWWAILALGRAWTFRVIVVPGDRLVRIGPYRFLRHPNYVAVMGELAGIALLSAARVTGPLAVLGFGWLVLRRIAVEERAIRTIGGSGV
jgi:methyltransferase